MKKSIYLIILAFLLLISTEIHAYNYKVGDKVRYKNIVFYVIGVNNNDNTVTLLKAEPLTMEEVYKYGEVGTDNLHVNMYMNERVSEANYRKPIDQVGYGGMSYLSNETCYGYADENNFIDSGCDADYNKSDVKYVVDAWKKDKMNSEIVKEVRLAKLDEITSLGYE